MTFLYFIGVLCIGGGVLYLYYLLLPEGSESDNPLRHVFGKAAWKFWEDNDERVERLTEQYLKLGVMYAAKNEAATQYHRQSGVKKKIKSEDGAITAFFKNISASHKAASRAGLTVDTHSKIAIEKAKVEPDLIKKQVEADIDRKMYVYDRMHEVHREYYRLKAADADQLEIRNQKLLWQELKREWESISKS